MTGFSARGAFVPKERSRSRLKNVASVLLRYYFRTLAWVFPGSGIGPKRLGVISRELGLLLANGLTVCEALDVVKEHSGDNISVEAVTNLQNQISDGVTLSAAMNKPEIGFPRLFASTVNAGEISGCLPRSFNSLGGLYERIVEIRSKLHLAAAYPFSVLLTAIPVTLFYFLVIVPNFRIFYNDFSGGEAQLPMLTRNVISISKFLEVYWPLLFLIPMFGFAFFRFRNSATGRRFFDWVILRIHTFGKITAYLDTARVARALAVALEAGVPMLEALRAASDIAENTVIKSSLYECIAKVESGASVSEAFGGQKVFPVIARRLIETAEKSNSLPRGLNMLADHLEREGNTALNMLLNLVEPALVLVIGGVVALTVCAMYLPIFNLVDIVK